MKRFNLLVLVLIAIPFLLYSQNPRNVDSRDFAVLLGAEVSESTKSIKLKWEINELAKQYRVFRKKVGDMSFGATPLATLDSTATEFTDTNVEIGVAYEYEVWVYSLGTAEGSPMNFWGFGYILTGIKVPEYEQSGYVLLLIDNSMTDPLKNEITRLKHDLRAEGWGVIEKYAPRTEAFDGAAVKQTKQLILDEYAKHGAKLKSIYILGRVAVPYSGDLYPDAHPDHRGAWPADIYYGYTNESAWTDVTVNVSTANRQANKNIPGDGKFDQTINNLALAQFSVGRVDLYGMKAFHGELQDPEAMLLKRYLDKNHNYRNGNFEFSNSGIIDDNFAASSFIEAFASSGWRNIGVLTDGKSVRKADFFNTLGTESHLFAYGCGGGSYTNCGGVGNTSDFASKPVNAVFTMLFGSYFGDWDIDNNFLRAPLASDPMALTSAWAGRPHWYFHHMAFGYPIGYSALLSHNNMDTYKPNIVYTAQYPNGVIYAIGRRHIHTALMGDPTLKLLPYSVPSPTNISLAVSTGLSAGAVGVYWDSPILEVPHHFNVYRSTSEFGLYQKVNDEPIAGNSYTDILDGKEFEKFDGPVYYMVRTAALETNNSGTYYNLSKGSFSDVIVSSIEDNYDNENMLSITPNPATDFVKINLQTSNSVNIEIDITDIRGNIVMNLKKDYLNSGSYNFDWNLRNSNGDILPNGIYFVRAKIGNDLIIRKLSILK